LNGVTIEIITNKMLSIAKKLITALIVKAIYSS